ncbi:hypothetical protein C0J08_04150 [Marinomonas sp. CT5]|nr:DUF3429 domain-containing protein [Marinomonas sp. CT5]NVK72799.1 DUF3429 domain-containing protein [Oceanospirillaceae bacterium]QUX94649.1 hypothetical protein C0J08_04150 [Marinomonas sp. CT5]
MRSYKAVVSALAILGIFPFLFATYLNLANDTFLGKSGVTLFAAYGAVILSFLGGTIWGRLIELPESRNGAKLLICSFVMVFLAWFSLLLKTPELSVVLLLLSLISIFWIDARWLKQANNQKPFYTSLNFGLTSATSIMHLLVLYPHY